MAVLERLQELTKRNEKHSVLGQWEKDFLSSLAEQVKRGRTLSVKQNTFLQKIESKLSDNSLHSLLEWEKEWDAEKQRKAQICAKYYQRTGYYSSLSNRVLTDPDWIMPREAYEKLCKNKYAQRVLEAVDSPALYGDGSVVALRATARNALSSRQFLKFKEKPLFVLEVLPDVQRAVKGAKVYKILSGTSTDVFEIEERFLKRFRKGRQR